MDTLVSGVQQSDLIFVCAGKGSQSLVSIRHHKAVTEFFSSDENFLIFTLSNCHICSIVLLTVVSILCITAS